MWFPHKTFHICITLFSCVGLLHVHEYFQENNLGQFPLNSHMNSGGWGSNIAHMQREEAQSLPSGYGT